MYVILSLDMAPGIRKHRVHVNPFPTKWLDGKTIVYVAGEECAEHVEQDSGMLVVKKGRVVRATV